MSDSAESTAAMPHVSEARGLLGDFEDLTAEEQRGALDHAIASLENARREL